MSDLDPATLLTRLARLIADGGSEHPLETRLARGYLTLLGGDGAAITLSYTLADRVTLTATDDIAARLEDLQDVLGEGPAPAAYTTGEITVADLGNSDPGQWPLFTEAARGLTGVLYAVPMRPGGVVLGVLSVHYPSASDLPNAETAQFLADAIGAALVKDSPTSESDWHHSSWASRSQIHQATGMVVAQLRISPDDALALLRAHAFSHNQTLPEVAEQILRRRLRFSDDPESETP
ncbi:GAF and ANTAR domain-containing protein [Kribbella lupini]|uniref:GAF domain-containing protein n=1 Tax=Kribbella lupini TaxID=291602 RepID=A0ABN2AI03_9ACTN